MKLISEVLEGLKDLVLMGVLTAHATIIMYMLKTGGSFPLPCPVLFEESLIMVVVRTIIHICYTHVCMCLYIQIF